MMIGIVVLFTNYPTFTKLHIKKDNFEMVAKCSVKITIFFSKAAFENELMIIFEPRCQQNPYIPDYYQMEQYFGCYQS